MGTHLIPRKVEGEGRILYIFTPRGLLGALIGLGIGVIFQQLFSALGAAIVGWCIMAVLALIGWGIMQGKIPDTNATDLFKKTGGEEVLTVITRYMAFNKKKKIYVNENAGKSTIAPATVISTKTGNKNKN